MKKVLFILAISMVALSSCSFTETKGENGSKVVSVKSDDQKLTEFTSKVKEGIDKVSEEVSKIDVNVEVSREE